MPTYKLAYPQASLPTSQPTYNSLSTSQLTYKSAYLQVSLLTSQPTYKSAYLQVSLLTSQPTSTRKQARKQAHK
jgi:hypothetical protein